MEHLFYVNKKILRLFGLPEAMLVAHIEEQILEGNENGWVTFTLPEAQMETGLPTYALRKAKKHLKASHFLITKQSGAPARTYYKLSFHAINQLR